MSHFRDTSGTRLRHPPQPRTRRSDESRRPRARIRRPPPSAPAPSRSFFQRLLSVLKNRPMRLPDGRANLVKLKGGGHVEARDTAERERAGIASTGIASTAPRAAAVSRRAVDPVRACLRRPAAAAAHRRLRSRLRWLCSPGLTGAAPAAAQHHAETYDDMSLKKDKRWRQTKANNPRDSGVCWAVAWMRP